MSTNGPLAPRMVWRMIYEMRTYKFDGNDGPQLANRFRDLALPLLERHGVKVLALWDVLIGSDIPKIMYMLVWESMGARQDTMTDLYADPAFADMMETTGHLCRMDIEFLQLASYSPDPFGHERSGGQHR